MLASLRSLASVGTNVRLSLLTGNEVVGTVIAYDARTVIIRTQDGHATISEDLIGAFELEAAKEEALERREVTSPTPIATSRDADARLGEFKREVLITKLERKGPVFKSPTLKADPSVQSSVVKEFGRIANRYQYLSKTKNMNPVPELALKLAKLGDRFPQCGRFYYNAGCLMLDVGNYKSALDFFKKAAESEPLPDCHYNIAYAAMEMRSYETAHIGLALYFNQIAPSIDPDAWRVFCSLTVSIRGYYAFASVCKQILAGFSAPTRKSISDLYQLLLALVYFLEENNNREQVTILKPYLSKKASFDPLQLGQLVTASLNSLPRTPGLQYDTALRQFEQSMGNRPILSQISAGQSLDRSQPQGYVRSYSSERLFGFIQDLAGKEYFFHRSSVTDKTLLARLDAKRFDESIPVNFTTKEAPKGPIAAQVSLHRPVAETFKLATSLADDGSYEEAMEQLRLVLEVDPKYPKALELYNRWREYARSGLPRGSNPYAKAKRAQVLEKDFDKAEQLFRTAMSSGDNFEAAVKDLAVTLIQKGKAGDAVKLLEENKTKVKNREALENLLLSAYQSARQYGHAISMLDLRLAGAKGSQREQILLTIGFLQMKKEDFTAAQAVFEGLLGNQPDNIGVRRNLALCLSKQEKYDQAERVLTQIPNIFTDAKTAALLEAITRARLTGGSIADRIVTETTISEFSTQRSAFADFVLRRCQFRGVTPRRVQTSPTGTKEFNGSKDVAARQIERLLEVAERLGAGRPRDRAAFYLSAARISRDVLDDRQQFLRFLSRSFTSEGDAAVIENKPLDVARAWYFESLRAYDGVRARSERKVERDPIYALIRYILSILGPGQITIGKGKTPSIQETLELVLGLHHSMETVFKYVTFLLLSGRYAADSVLHALFRSNFSRQKSLEYLATQGIPIDAGKIEREGFFRLWNGWLQRASFENQLLAAMFGALVQTQLTTASLEDALKTLDGFIGKMFFGFETEVNRLRGLSNILNAALQLSKQNTFEERERLSLQVDKDCNNLLEDMGASPTHFSIDHIMPVVEAIKKRNGQALDRLYETATPDLGLRLAMETYAPSDAREIQVQLVAENKLGRSPAEVVEVVIPQPDETLFVPCYPETKMEGSLRGGEQRILIVPLRVTEKALESQTFSLPVYAKYMTRSGEVEQTRVESFSVRLYAPESFEPVDNPYASYAEGGIVEDPSMFFGRDDLIRSLASAIRNQQNVGKSYIIYGQKRAGKSSILHHLKERLKDDNRFLVLWVGNIGLVLDEDSKTTFAHQILWAILEVLRMAIEDRATSSIQRLELSFPTTEEFFNHPVPLQRFNTLLADFRRRAAQLESWKGVQIVLFIDEFSYIYGHILAGRIPETFMKSWKAILQENRISAVLAGQDFMPRFKQRFPNEFGTTQDERVSYLRPEDARRLIDEPIRIGGRKGESRYRERAIERILDLTAGSPFYIQMLCNRLVEHMNQERAKFVTEADVEQVKNELISTLGPDKFDNLFSSGDTTSDAISDSDTVAVLEVIAKHSQVGSCPRTFVTASTKAAIDDILENLVQREVVTAEKGQVYRIRVGLLKEWILAKL